jgi:hypothetical protein
MHLMGIYMLSHLNVRDTFQAVHLIPIPTASSIARSTRINVTPASMNLGANTFHTMRCLLSHAEHRAEAKVTAV